MCKFYVFASPGTPPTQEEETPPGWTQILSNTHCTNVKIILGGAHTLAECGAAALADPGCAHIIAYYPGCNANYCGECRCLTVGETECTAESTGVPHRVYAYSPPQEEQASVCRIVFTSTYASATTNYHYQSTGNGHNPVNSGYQSGATGFLNWVGGHNAA